MNGYTIPKFGTLKQLAADLDEDEQSDADIIDCMVERFTMTRAEAVKRLARVNFIGLIVAEL